MFQALALVLIAVIWIEAARLLRVGDEESLVMQAVVFAAGPMICIYLLIISCMSCIFEPDGV